MYFSNVFSDCGTCTYCSQLVGTCEAHVAHQLRAHFMQQGWRCNHAVVSLKSVPFSGSLTVCFKIVLLLNCVSPKIRFPRSNKLVQIHENHTYSDKHVISPFFMEAYFYR